MKYIHQPDNVHIEWILDNRMTGEPVDLTRRKHIVLLCYDNNRIAIHAEVERGRIVADLKAPLPIAVYDLQLLSVEPPANRNVIRVTAASVFAITAGSDEGDQAIKIRSRVGRGMYDGLDAYEMAVLRGLVGVSETDWLIGQDYLLMLEKLSDRHDLEVKKIIEQHKLDTDSIHTLLVKFGKQLNSQDKDFKKHLEDAQIKSANLETLTNKLQKFLEDYGDEVQKIESSFSGINETLKDHTDDLAYLHKASELTVAHIETTPKNGGVIEFTGEEMNVNVKGWGVLQYYGDADDVNVAPDNISLHYASPGGSFRPIMNMTMDGDYATASQKLDYSVGAHIFKASVKNDTVTKTVESKVNVSLRMFFGFMEEEPTQVTALNTGVVSASRACSVTVKPNPTKSTGDDFKKIYFAIPASWGKPTVMQGSYPFELDSKFSKTLVRNIDGIGYRYNLYRSTEFVDSKSSKALKLS